MQHLDGAMPRDDESKVTATSAVELARHLVGARSAWLMLPTVEAPHLRTVAASTLRPGSDSGANDKPIARIGPMHPTAAAVDDSGCWPRDGIGVGGTTLGVVVRLADSSFGMLNVTGPIARGAFDEGDLVVLQAFAEQLAHALCGIEERCRARQLEAQVRQLHRRLIEAQEAERRRIAWDLHDETGHLLSAALLRLDLATMQLPPEPGGLRTEREQTRASLVECTEGLHAIAFNLRPRVLEDLGLAAALRSLVLQANDLGQARVTLTLAGDARMLSEENELTVFRVVQEALTNIRKHARATEVVVKLVYRPQRITLTIEDDGIGIGIHPARGRRGASLGLAGMRERVELASGTLTVRIREGGGTVLIARLPVGDGWRYSL